MTPTPAHYQNVTINVRLREWVPEHEPRDTDPTYKLFRKAKREMKRLDLPCWRCGVHYADLVKKGDQPTQKNPLAAYQLEAHHSQLEFSLLNAIDVEKWWESSTREDPGFMVESFSNVDRWLQEHPQYAGKPHDEVFLAYMESDGNLTQLCLTPESPVLMANGYERPIAELHVGDSVMGPDGKGHTVTDATRRWHSGDIVAIDGHRMTANHPVLTPAGWTPAGLVRQGQVLAHLMEVAVAEMVGLRAIEPEVLDAVVRPISVDVMDRLSLGEPTTEMLLHNPTMLGDRHEIAVSVDTSASIPLGRGGNTEQYVFWGERLVVEDGQAAVVGAKAMHGASLVSEREPTTLAGSRLGMDASVPNTPLCGATAAAGRISVGDLWRDEEISSADTTGTCDARSAHDARWRAVREVRREGFSGFVHDISVADYPAFITGDLIVHNCDVCHRSKDQGVHHIPYPDWRARKVWREDLPAHIQQGTPAWMG